MILLLFGCSGGEYTINLPANPAPLIPPPPEQRLQLTQQQRIEDVGRCKIELPANASAILDGHAYCVCAEDEIEGYVTSSEYYAYLSAGPSPWSSARWALFPKAIAIMKVCVLRTIHPGLEKDVRFY